MIYTKVLYIRQLTKFELNTPSQYVVILNDTFISSSVNSKPHTKHSPFIINSFVSSDSSEKIFKI